VTSDRLMVSDRVEFVLNVDVAHYVQARQEGGLVLSPGMAQAAAEPTVDSITTDSPTTSRIQPSRNEISSPNIRGNVPVTDASYSIVRPLPIEVPGLQQDLGLTHLFQTAGFQDHRYAMRIAQVPLNGFASFVERVKGSGLNPDYLMYSLTQDGNVAFVYYQFFNFQREVVAAVSSLPAWIQRAQPFADQLDRK